MMTDGGVKDSGVALVKASQRLFIRVMEGTYERTWDKPGIRDSGGTVDVDQIAVSRCVLNGPCDVIQLLEHAGALCRQRPFGVRITPALLNLYRGLSIAVNDGSDPSSFQALGQIGHKQLSSSITGRGNRNKRRSD